MTAIVAKTLSEVERILECDAQGSSRISDQGHHHPLHPCPCILNGRIILCAQVRVFLEVKLS